MDKTNDINKETGSFSRRSSLMFYLLDRVCGVVFIVSLLSALYSFYSGDFYEAVILLVNCIGWGIAGAFVNAKRRDADILFGFE